MIEKFLLVTLFCFTIFLTQAQDSLSFLALGDSYTIGERVSVQARWPMQLQDSLNRRGYKIEKPLIIAKTGWRTDELKEAIIKQSPANDYDLVGLLIGVNNQYQGKSPTSYKPEFKELLAMAIAHAGGDKKKVFVVSIPDYGYTPFGAKNQQKISAEIDEYNNINKTLAEEAGVKYYYITDISRSKEEGLVAKDNLHPSGRQYARWVEHILRDESFYSMLK